MSGKFKKHWIHDDYTGWHEYAYFDASVYEMSLWISKNVDNWMSDSLCGKLGRTTHIKFKHEKDALAFILRWGKGERPA